MKKNYIILGLGVVIVVPIFIGLLVMIPGLVPIDNEWIGFWGGYGGGIITLLGVGLSIRYYKEQDKKRKADLDDHNLKLLYWHLKLQIDKINELHNHIVKFENQYVPLSEIFTKSDYDYYFDKLAYVDRIFDNDEVKRLNFYYKELFDLETIRREYNRIREHEDENTYKNAKELQMCFDGFKSQLVSVYNLYKEGGFYMGLIPTPCNISELIKKLGNHLGIQEDEPEQDPLFDLIEAADAIVQNL